MLNVSTNFRIIKRGIGLLSGLSKMNDRQQKGQKSK
jgi:hypothetical protein